MAENSTIEWTDHTFNGWIGCTKVDELCTHCYAETRDKRHLIEKVDHWGKGAPRLRTSASTWKQPLKWNRHATLIIEAWNTFRDQIGTTDEKLIAGGHEKPRRPRVFSASLADWLDDDNVPIEWLADFLKLIHDTPNLDWLLLTKRPENWAKRMSRIATERNPSDCGMLHGHISQIAQLWLSGQRIPPNVWIGTSVGTQKSADTRIPELLKIPAKVRFLSCEPLLEKTNIRGYLMDFVSKDPGKCGNCGKGHGFGRCPNYGGISKTDAEYGCENFKRVDFAIHWVICGGESGSKARPMHPDWARGLRDQCQAAGVPFFFKQWGEWLPGEATADSGTGYRRCDNGEIYGSTKYPKRDNFGTHPDKHSGNLITLRVGKKAAGRLLDGKEWSEFPGK